MGGDSDDDFTFCQVTPPSNRNGFDDPNAVPDISSIAIKDENPSGSTGETTLVKQKTVGALSFNVIDASSKKKSDNVPLQSGSGSGVSIKDTTGRDPTVKKPAGRAKVPFEKGYSQMDWLKLTRTHPDLAGLKGQSSRRLISMSEVKQHQTEGSMWTVLKGQVYNIAPYMKFHPGGVDMLMKAVGKDCTSLFNKYHAWVNAEFLLEKCLVGIFDENGDRK